MSVNRTIDCRYSASAVRKEALGVCGGRGVILRDAHRSSQVICDSPGSQVAIGSDGEITRSDSIGPLAFLTVVQAEVVEANNIERKIATIFGMLSACAQFAIEKDLKGFGVKILR